MFPNGLNRKIIPEIILTGILIAIFHQMAISLYLYWIISWSDIVMHFLGGIFGGLSATFIILKFVKEDFSKHKFILFYTSVSAVLIFGVFWELFEIFMRFTDIQSDLRDTILDLIMDTLGAIFAYFYIVKKLWKKSD